MISITLLCSLGMSTSMLVDNMNEVAKKRNIELDIEALPFDKASDRLQKTDILLIGPQIKHMLPKFQEKYRSAIPVISVIDFRDYGLVRGEKILDESLGRLDGAGDPAP
ncbi:MAG: PTS sugar transporter subunit IIB [Clostridiales Family XIII bacterium]|nr:PTS sugar transporter subunit IIB [Clostridiales Family XIII bacterium]